MSITSPTFTPGAVLYADDLDTAMATLTDEINRLAALPHNSQNLAKNLLINGDFSQWQYGTSQTTSGYGSDDRFNNLNTGSTKVASQQAFTIGQTDVTNNPKYYGRTVVTSVANAANFVYKEQRIEDVTKLSGETVTLQFFAKVGSAKNIAVELVQNFGTGGSPSSPVTNLGTTTLAITTSWVLQTVTIALPSVSGKTLGTAGDDYTGVRIWMDAGSDYDAQTNSLGQQSGTFDIANMQLEISATATDFEYVTPADQLARCQRYFERIDQGASSAAISTGYSDTTTIARYYIKYNIEKRAAPTLSFSSQTGFKILRAGTDVFTASIASSGPTAFGSRLNTTAVGLVAGEGSLLIIDDSGVGYIEVSAEL